MPCAQQGTGVTVQAMAFGNMGPTSGTGEVASANCAIPVAICPDSQLDEYDDGRRLFVPHEPQVSINH